VKGCVRDDNNKRVKVEFTILLIWYGKLPGERRKEEEEEEEEEDNLTLVGLGALW
jgi:hypothetical protein